MKSSIAIFILKINSIASLPNSIVDPEVGRLFQLVLGLKFMQLDP
jgi:hypothetical protein